MSQLLYSKSQVSWHKKMPCLVLLLLLCVATYRSCQVTGEVSGMGCWVPLMQRWRSAQQMGFLEGQDAVLMAKQTVPNS